MQKDSSVAEKMRAFSGLPLDLLRTILDNAAGPDVIALCSANRRFYRLFWQDLRLWERLYRRDLSSARHEDGTYKRSESDYKKAYLRVWKLEGETRTAFAIEKGYEKLIGPPFPVNSLTLAVKSGHEDVERVIIRRYCYENSRSTLIDIFSSKEPWLMDLRQAIQALQEQGRAQAFGEMLLSWAEKGARQT